MLMAHGDADLYCDYQGSDRGDDQVGSTNCAMVMAMQQLGRGMLHLDGMLSAEPFTVGALAPYEIRCGRGERHSRRLASGPMQLVCLRSARRRKSCLDGLAVTT